MISAHFNISNPWAKDNFENLWNKSWLPFKHKGVELELIRHAYDIFEVHLSITARTDHAGVSAKLGLFGYSVHFSFYDTRHWDSENDQWQVYDEAYFAKANESALVYQAMVEKQKTERKEKKEQLKRLKEMAEQAEYEKEVPISNNIVEAQNEQKAL